jgi:hypothetical protein
MSAVKTFPSGKNLVSSFMKALTRETLLPAEVISIFIAGYE